LRDEKVAVRLEIIFPKSTPKEAPDAILGLQGEQAIKVLQ
jgi:hypothetical protein